LAAAFFHWLRIFVSVKVGIYFRLSRRSLARCGFGNSRGSEVREFKIFIRCLRILCMLVEERVETIILELNDVELPVILYRAYHTAWQFGERLSSSNTNPAPTGDVQELLTTDRSTVTGIHRHCTLLNVSSRSAAYGSIDMLSTLTRPHTLHVYDDCFRCTRWSGTIKGDRQQVIPCARHLVWRCRRRTIRPVSID
jgi:hypothetical protein